MAASFSQWLLSWYGRSARSLPWRETSDPYAIWVAEIMLQQTRVETVIPYYHRWMQRFPTTAALAAADEQEVLKVWEGLGYYSRARSLQRAAMLVMERHNGIIPASRAELEALPGVGPYTAGAIASIAYGQDEIALDGNLRRVLARVFDIDLPARSPQAEQQFARCWRENLPAGRAGDYNQALMDLGALICAPRSPACAACPLQGICLAEKLGLQDKRPVLEKKTPLPHHIVTAAVIRIEDKVLIARRPANGLLGGLWEFPGGKLEPGEDLHACLKREISEELGVLVRVGAQIGVYKHAYTHFKVTLHAFACELEAGEPRAVQAAEIYWANLGDLANFPMGKIDRMISAALISG